MSLVACIQADNSDHNKDKVTLISSQPAMLCLEYDDKTYTALISGRKTPVLVVSKYRPTLKNSGLSVYLVNKKKGIKTPIIHPAIHPSIPFDIKDGTAPMRFNMSMKENSKQFGTSKTCFEVAFNVTDDANGFAEIYFTIF